MAGKSESQKQLFHEPAMKKHKEQFVSKIIINQNIYIPEEVQFCILRNLSGKSLVRFKCLNKSLNFVISDPNFISKTPQLILGCLYSMYLVNCQGEATKLDSPIKAEKGSVVRVMAPCNGILWINVNSENLIWNPFTGEHKIMPNGPSHAGIYDPTGDGSGLGYGFGYNHTTKDYNIICIPFKGILKPFIYSVKNDSYESLEEIIPHHSSMAFYRKEGFPMKNGSVLYWSITYCCSRTIDFRDKRNKSRTRTCVFCHEGGSTEWHLFILEFDLVNRKQVLIPQPLITYNMNEANSNMVRKLVDFKGSLCAATGTYGITDLWLLKKDESKKNWVKFMSIDFNDRYFWGLPMWINSDEEVVMSNMTERKIVCYNRNDPTENRLRSAKVHEVGRWDEQIAYTQTLASILS